VVGRKKPAHHQEHCSDIFGGCFQFPVSPVIFIADLISCRLEFFLSAAHGGMYTRVRRPVISTAAALTMVTMGGDLKPGCLADRLLTGLGHPQINPQAQKETEKVCCSAEKGNYEQVNC